MPYPLVITHLQALGKADLDLEISRFSLRKQEEIGWNLQHNQH